MKEYHKRPESRARARIQDRARYESVKQHRKKPEVKAKLKENKKRHRNKPEVKANHKAYMKEYHKRKKAEKLAKEAKK